MQFTFTPAPTTGGATATDNTIRLLQGGTTNATIYGTIAAALAASFMR